MTEHDTLQERSLNYLGNNCEEAQVMNGEGSRWASETICESAAFEMEIPLRTSAPSETVNCPKKCTIAICHSQAWKNSALHSARLKYWAKRDFSNTSIKQLGSQSNGQMCNDTYILERRRGRKASSATLWPTEQCLDQSEIQFHLPLKITVTVPAFRIVKEPYVFELQW